MKWALLLGVLLGIIVLITGCNDQAPKPAVTQSAQTPWQAWYNGGGFARYQAVANDITSLNNDVGSGDTSLVTAGLTLAEDAREASEDPMPVYTSQYQEVMNQLAAAGVDVADGDYTGATSLFNSASTGMNTLASEIQALQQDNGEI